MNDPGPSSGSPPVPVPVESRFRHPRTISWILGIIILGAVITAALHRSEGREFIHLAERAKPWWLLVAFVLQAATYFAQGESWRLVGRAAGFPLRAGAAFQLSLAKLFVDQAVPSAGISGTVLVARSLEERGMPRTVVTAGVVVNTASYNIAYVASLMIAVITTMVMGHMNELVVIVATLLSLAMLAVVVTVLEVSGRKPGTPIRQITRLRPLRRLLDYLEEAETSLVRDPGLIARISLAQFSIVVLDAATIWVLVKAMGTTASVPGVFASFMISNLFRTIGIVPGGLGTFEATSVVTLKLAGLPLPVALSATLLFRGLSFWLPMVPGLWLSRRLLRRVSTGPSC